MPSTPVRSALAPITVAGVLSLGLGAGGLGLLFAACALAVPLLAAPWLGPRKDPATR